MVSLQSFASPYIILCLFIIDPLPPPYQLLCLSPPNTLSLWGDSRNLLLSCPQDPLPTLIIKKSKSLPTLIIIKNKSLPTLIIIKNKSLPPLINFYLQFLTLLYVSFLKINLMIMMIFPIWSGGASISLPYRPQKIISKKKCQYGGDMGGKYLPRQIILEKS